MVLKQPGKLLNEYFLGRQCALSAFPRSSNSTPKDERPELTQGKEFIKAKRFCHSLSHPLECLVQFDSAPIELGDSVEHASISFLSFRARGRLFRWMGQCLIDPNTCLK